MLDQFTLNRFDTQPRYEVNSSLYKIDGYRGSNKSEYVLSLLVSKFYTDFSTSGVGIL